MEITKSVSKKLVDKVNEHLNKNTNPDSMVIATGGEGIVYLISLEDKKGMQNDKSQGSSLMSTKSKSESHRSRLSLSSKKNKRRGSNFNISTLTPIKETTMTTIEETSSEKSGNSNDDTMTTTKDDETNINDKNLLTKSSEKNKETTSSSLPVTKSTEVKVEVESKMKTTESNQNVSSASKDSNHSSVTTQMNSEQTKTNLSSSSKKLVESKGSSVNEQDKDEDLLSKILVQLRDPKTGAKNDNIKGEMLFAVKQTRFYKNPQIENEAKKKVLDKYNIKALREALIWDDMRKRDPFHLFHPMFFGFVDMTKQLEDAAGKDEFKDIVKRKIEIDRLAQNDNDKYVQGDMEISVSEFIPMDLHKYLVAVRKGEVTWFLHTQLQMMMNLINGNLILGNEYFNCDIKPINIMLKQIGENTYEEVEGGGVSWKEMKPTEPRFKEISDSYNANAILFYPMELYPKEFYKTQTIDLGNDYWEDMHMSKELKESMEIVPQYHMCMTGSVDYAPVEWGGYQTTHSTFDLYSFAVLNLNFLLWEMGMDSYSALNMIFTNMRTDPLAKTEEDYFVTKWKGELEKHSIYILVKDEWESKELIKKEEEKNTPKEKIEEMVRQKRETMWGKIKEGLTQGGLFLMTIDENSFFRDTKFYIEKPQEDPKPEFIEFFVENQEFIKPLLFSLNHYFWHNLFGEIYTKNVLKEEPESQNLGKVSIFVTDRERFYNQ